MQPSQLEVLISIIDINIELPSLSKELVIAGRAVAIGVAGRFFLVLVVSFDKHAPRQPVYGRVLDQQAADELGATTPSQGPAKEALGEVLGERGGYGSVFVCVSC